MTNVLSGARAIFYVQGNKIAYASGVSVDEEIMYEEVDVLDRLSVQEHVPVGYRVNLSAEFFRTIAGAVTNTTQGASAPMGVSQVPGVMGSAKAMGLFPKVGLDEKNGLLAPEMTVTLIDNLTNTVWDTIEGVKGASNGFRTSARQLIGVNVRFVAIRARDETETGISGQ